MSQPPDDPTGVPTGGPRPPAAPAPPADAPVSNAPFAPLDTGREEILDATSGHDVDLTGDRAVDRTVSESTVVPAGAVVAARQTSGLYWRIVAIIIAADQLTKAAISAAIAPYESVTVIPGLLDLTYVRNPGVAFGLLSDLDLPLMPYITAALAILALVGIAYYAKHVRPEERLARIGLSLILGGAIGNLIDRFRQQYVLDFVDVYFGDWHFWAFNVADASITIGAILVFFELLTHRHASNPV